MFQRPPPQIKRWNHACDAGADLAKRGLGHIRSPISNIGITLTGIPGRYFTVTRVVERSPVLTRSAALEEESRVGRRSYSGSLSYPTIRRDRSQKNVFKPCRNSNINPLDGDFSGAPRSAPEAVSDGIDEVSTELEVRETSIINHWTTIITRAIPWKTIRLYGALRPVFRSTRISACFTQKLILSGDFFFFFTIVFKRLNSFENKQQKLKNSSGP